MPTHSAYLKLHDWPVAERERWEACRLSEPDCEGAFADSSEFWKECTWATVLDGYAHFLGYLFAMGDLNPHETPGSRGTADRIEGYLSYLDQRVSEGTKYSRINNLERATWLLSPSARSKLLRRTLKNLKRPKMRETVRHLRSRADYLAFASSLMEQNTVCNNIYQKRSAINFRNGLIISSLCCRPLRRRTFAGLCIGIDIRKVKGNWWLICPKLKHGHVQMRWPDELVEPLEIYIRVHRPILAGRQLGAGNALWLTYEGRPMTGRTMFAAISNATRKAFGEGIGPHEFRRIVATELYADGAGDVDAIAPILSQARLDMAERHYIRSNAATFFDAHDNLLAKLRGDDNEPPT
jgi:integrase